MKSWAYGSRFESLDLRSIKTSFRSTFHLLLLVFLPSLSVWLFKIYTKVVIHVIMTQKRKISIGLRCPYFSQKNWAYPCACDVQECLLFPPRSSCHSGYIPGNQFAPVVWQEQSQMLHSKCTLMYWKIGIEFKISLNILKKLPQI